MTWWNNDYGWRRKLTVTTTDAVVAGYSAKFLCTGAIAAEIYGKSLASGDDFRILYWNGAAWEGLDRHLVTFSSSEIEVWFKLQVGVDGSDDNYYAYYDYASAGSPPADRSEVYYLWEDFEGETIGSLEGQGWEKYFTASGDDPVYAIESSELSIDNHDSGYGSWAAFAKYFALSDYICDVDVMNKDEEGGYTPGPGLAVRIQEGNPGLCHSGLIHPYYPFWQFMGTYGYPDELLRNHWYNLKIRCLGSSLIFYIDDAETCVKSSDTYPTGGVATTQRDVHAHYNNFRVRRLVATEPGVAASDAEEAPAPVSKTVSDVGSGAGALAVIKSYASHQAYAGFCESGVYVFVGSRWRARSVGLSGDALKVVDLSCSSLNPAKLVIATDDGLYKSSDSAFNWSSASVAQPTNSAGDSPAPTLSDLEWLSVRLSENTGGLAYALARRKTGVSRSWLYKSTDWGVNWTCEIQLVLSGSYNIYAFSLDLASDADTVAIAVKARP